jgi:hypothetical protein
MMTGTERWFDAKSLTLFGFFVLFGASVMLYPVPALILFVAIGAGAFALHAVRVNHLKLWQTLTLAALTGYMVLNYGFENIALHIGIPIILGHSLMFAALALAVVRYRRVLRAALAEPAMKFILVLIAFTCVHLVLDIPHYGLYALRDASMTFEGIFLLLGLLWTIERRNTELLTKWLFLVVVLTLIYSLSYSWRQTLQGVSPVSGVFQPISILGHYHGTDPHLMLGTLFCLSVGRYLVKWRWLLFVLAAAQLFELAVFQVRAMYLAIPLILAVLLLFGEIGKFAQFAFVLSLGLVALLFLTSIFGVHMEGRIGSVDLSFVEEHAESLLGKSTAPAEGSVEDRRDWYAQVFRRIRSSTSNLLVGEGFGEPLIKFGGRNKINNQVVETRQPHNTHLTFLARLGLLGLTLWAALNFYIVARFIFALRRRVYHDRKLHDLILWLFFYYIIATIHASTQPGFEFSAGAIPFYFLMGVGLGIIRWHLPPSAGEGRKREFASYSLAR